MACLSGAISDHIKEEKRKNENTFVMVIAHWGVDFQPVVSSQRTYAKNLIGCGADLVIGHGAHMTQSMEQVDGKWVLYGIGNGVFNSDGEYEKNQVPPYSFLAQLRFEKRGKKSLYLYPLYSDNLKTFWQTRPVTDEQLDELLSYHKAIGSSIKNWESGCDDFGKYIRIKID